jgi:hypothetical protein
VNLGADDTLDATEDVGVRTPLDLRQQAALASVEERQPVDERQAVRQKLLREFELPIADHVAIDVPPDPFGDRNAPRVPCGFDVGFETR